MNDDSRRTVTFGGEHYGSSSSPRSGTNSPAPDESLTIADVVREIRALVQHQSRMQEQQDQIAKQVEKLTDNLSAGNARELVGRTLFASDVPGSNLSMYGNLTNVISNLRQEQFKDEKHRTTWRLRSVTGVELRPCRGL